MIGYNKTWLNNLLLHHETEQLQLAGCITANEVKAIKQAYPVGFYTPGIMVRVGLFLLSCIIVSFSFGLLSLFLSATRIIETPGWGLFLGVLATIALEFMVTKQNHYRSGVDDALQWIAAGIIAGSLTWLVYSFNSAYHDPSYLTISLIIFITGLCFTIRYADVGMSIVTCLAFFSVIFFTWKNIGAFGTATMPFMLMLISALVYLAALRLKTVYYATILAAVQTVSLVIFYSAGNYLVIDKLNNALNGPDVLNGASAPVHWGPFFWLWTMLLPLLYLARGVIRKNTILLRTGLVLFAVAIYTFRTYYHILSIELALILGGALLLAITYSIINYLKTPKHGFTYADIDKVDNLKLESLITAGTLGHVAAAPVKPESRFGGGDFGGGGSGGAF